MILFAADENFNNHIIRGLLLRKRSLDIARIQDVGLSGKADPEILDWATAEQRILLTHDVETIPEFVYNRIDRGELVTGVFIVSQDTPFRHIIEDLILVVECSEYEEWQNQVFYLPFK
ncbi:MAG: DUF5615 family PIN-like protein [Candidatus Loosdrechtia sp.]|uniref:DUF5615 family PIN-like protein n=1 Tax=Candidatus Loosdrechtia sp. TaxID=3101272 RepID=UPI003A5F68EB|nr:MAG: DUF5615 family PIN-like protein [Candidatus Jettenia sp. AMX2]